MRNMSQGIAAPPPEVDEPCHESEVPNHPSVRRDVRLRSTILTFAAVRAAVVRRLVWPSAALLMGVSSPNAASAATLVLDKVSGRHVTNQSTIDAAVHGDMISTPSGTNGEDWRLNGKWLRVRSVEGSHFILPPTATTSLARFKLPGAALPSGAFCGALLIDDASPTISSCLIQGNDRPNDEYIWNEDAASSPLISAVIIQRDTAFAGGAIYVRTASPIVAASEAYSEALSVAEGNHLGVSDKIVTSDNILTDFQPLHISDESVIDSKQGSWTDFELQDRERFGWALGLGSHPAAPPELVLLASAPSCGVRCQGWAAWWSLGKHFAGDGTPLGVQEGFLPGEVCGGSEAVIRGAPWVGTPDEIARLAGAVYRFSEAGEVERVRTVLRFEAGYGSVVSTFGEGVR